MVRGDAALVAQACAPDAVFCDVQGTCTEGHDAIEKSMAERLKAERPRSATAHSTRRIVAGGFVYEWGSARLVTAGGKPAGGRYFTVWVQSGGRWKIFRNLVMP